MDGQGLIYYLGLETLWILTNIAAGPDEVVNELIFGEPKPNCETIMA